MSGGHAGDGQHRNPQEKPSEKATAEHHEHHSPTENEPSWLEGLAALAERARNSVTVVLGQRADEEHSRPDKAVMEDRRRLATIRKQLAVDGMRDGLVQEEKMPVEMQL